MRRIESPLFVLHEDAGLRRRLKAVSRAAGYDFEVVPDWETLRQRIEESPASAVVVVDPDFGAAGRAGARTARWGPSPSLYALVDAFPSIPIIAALRFTPERGEEIRRMGEFGVAHVIGVGHDDTPGALEWHLREARGRSLRALLERVLPPDLPGRAHVILEEAVDITVAGERGRDLAARLGLSRKALMRWCYRAGLPAPRRLLAWIRILLAAALLDDPGRTVGSVARVAGYHSDPALRRVTKSFLGLSPSDLRKQGAFEAAAAGFLEELSAMEASQNHTRGM